MQESSDKKSAAVENNSDPSVSGQSSDRISNNGSSSASAAQDMPGKVSKLSVGGIILLGMLAAFGPVTTDLYLPAIPEITRDLATDAASMQLTLTTSFLGLALGQLIIGPLSDAYGRRVPLLTSLVVFVISSVWCAFAADVHQLITARFFQGLAGAGGIVLCRTIACDLYSGADLPRFMSLLMTINALAPILGPIAGSGIVAVFTWPAVFVFLALWGVALIGGTVKNVPETLPKEKRSSHLLVTLKEMLNELTNGRFLLYSMALSFIMGSFFAYLAASPFVFQSIFGLSPSGYSLVFGINAFAITVAANIAGRAVRFVKERAIVTTAIVVQFICCLVFAGILITSYANIYNIAAVFGVFVSMMGVAQTAGFGIVMGSRSGGSGSAAGIFGVLTFFFGALTTPLVGLMGEDSMVPTLLTMFVCTIMAYVCFITASRCKNSSLADHEAENEARERAQAAAAAEAPADCVPADAVPACATVEAEVQDAQRQNRI
ncbi:MULTISPECIES: multidrug effflux MFS transporter [unclassified Anaerobiospirillum]|uniref:multidrug effflux MFS transporter n=1 Tax=unclassified Anaerobiospirillum TaxID=2647410 RepID=UPI001FF4F986|nr:MULTISPECIES: multidrug effflux MFS transporter [unclassified Anaerobiospirillum]MCK0534634.1 multidrug effflux MFS transporter [Anaerobiospirillum sp. NML120511]MCK0540334.1 multidrug effflux MFS transporter [Anaerobiospirillum sp. NML02-A-032]